jgi:DNA repair protein RadC
MHLVTTSGPRERALEQGVDALGDADLVALLLGTGRRGAAAPVLAAELLVEAGGLDGLARSGTHALASAAGLGVVKALRLAAAVELGRRTSRLAVADRPTLASAADVAGHLGPRLAGLVHEEMWVVSLDGRNRIRGARRVAQGGLHGCAVAARDILRVALADAASAFVLVHNHPSGDPTPSPEDVAMTAAVSRAAAVVGVPLVDHVVLGGVRHASLLELGVLDDDLTPRVGPGDHGGTARHVRPLPSR